MNCKLLNMFSCVLGSVSEATVSETAAELETVTGATQATLVIAKRQAPEMQEETCLVYRYGSSSTTIDVVREYFHLIDA